MHATSTQPPDEGRGAVAIALLAVALACALACSVGCNHVETAVGSVTIDLHLAADVTAEITDPQGERIATITTRKDAAACAPLCATMLGCGADTPTLPSHAKVYGVTIDRTGQPATHYRIHTKGERDAEAIELSTPGIYCPGCKHHIPVLQDDPPKVPAG